LVEGLKSGKLGGVALDVYATEPCKSHPLFTMPNVVCTPHLGASTEEAQTQVAVEGCELLVNFFATGAIRHAVNMTTLDATKLEALRDYLDLGYRLGMLLSQLDRQPAKSCRVLYRGEIAEKETKILTAVFAAGLLQGALDQEVNLVNAELVLKQRGIKLTEESRSEMGSFRSSMTAEVTYDHGQHKAAATIFGQHMPRLVSLDDRRLEAYLDGRILVFRHHDVPGIIGAVGTIFGKHGVNIAQMAVGRDTPGGEAVGVLNLDTEPSPEALADVRKLPAITSATVIRLPPAGQLPSWLQG
ncbi:MAG TPA: ACT domain-containing protein, partial [Lacipirellulaceae bacterium]|nr:ACT domain-containing protein [Lacipirellulaceae bacterium]